MRIKEIKNRLQEVCKKTETQIGFPYSELVGVLGIEGHPHAFYPFYISLAANVEFLSKVFPLFPSFKNIQF